MTATVSERRRESYRSQVRVRSREQEGPEGRQTENNRDSNCNVHHAVHYIEKINKGDTAKPGVSRNITLNI